MKRKCCLLSSVVEQLIGRSSNPTVSAKYLMIRPVREVVNSHDFCACIHGFKSPYGSPPAMIKKCF